MKKLKTICCLICIFFLTGCSVQYNVKIDSNLKISETINISETSTFFETNYTYYSKREVIDSYWNNNIVDYPNAGYSYIYNDTDTGAIVSANHNSIADYKDKTSIYKQYFDEINIEQTDTITTIETNGFTPYNEQDFERFAIENLKITIEIPFNVIKTNADEINGNEYTWNIDRDTKTKKILISFNQSEQIKKENKNFYYPIIFGIIIAIIILIIYVIYRIKRNDDNF